MLAALSLATSLWVLSQGAGERAVQPSDTVQGSGLVPVERIADDFGRDLAWVVGSHAADLYATSWALSRCDGHCGEGNPLGPTPEARIALKMAGSASAGLTLWKLRRDGHGRLATVIRWGYVAFNSILVVNNVRLGVRK